MYRGEKKLPGPLIAVTNRKLCKGDYLAQIKRLCSAGVDGLILREKDLSEEEYKLLAGRVLEICEAYKVSCMLHSFTGIGYEHRAAGVHLPLERAKEIGRSALEEYPIVGISVHSKAQALEAAEMGAAYVTAGHIFATACKEGVAPRGLPFLAELCESISIPVYAIGGIQKEQISAVIRQGAKGVCVMSGFMNASKREVQEYKIYLENAKKVEKVQNFNIEKDLTNKERRTII